MGDAKIGEELRSTLERGNASFRALANALPQFVWITDGAGALEWVNERWTAYTGLGIDQTVDPGWQAAVHPDDTPDVAERWRASIGGGTPCEFEYRVRDRDGVYRWHLGRVSPVHDERGNVVCWFGTGTDIDTRRRVEDELRASEEALRRREAEARARAEELSVLLEVTPAAVWIAHDTECREVRGNRVGHELLRMPPGVNLSKTAYDPSPTSHFEIYRDGAPLPAHELALQKAAREGVVIRDCEEELRFANGEVVHLLGSAVPLRDEAGRPRGAVAAFIDVTAIKEAEAAHRAADKRKDEFLALLSHELRNPLAPIVTAVQLMKLRDDASSRLEISVIDRQVRYMMRLVDDLLDISRIERGKIELRRSVIDLASVIAHAVETATPLFEQRNHRLTVDAQDGLLVDVDEARLVQVVSNLLTNAAKYTPTGGSVTLEVTRAEREAVIRVRDNGTGIPPELLPRVFDLFFQASRRSERGGGGLGLGLALVRSLTELHGGHVEARSDGPGRGSEFTVYLPLASSASGSGETPIAPRIRSGRARSPRHILVVDDNADAADLVARALESAGHFVRVANHPSAALSILGSFTPEIVILDIGLPTMDGYELGEAIRRRFGELGPVLIALTGYGAEHDRDRSRDAGFRAHIVKPVDLERLLTLVDDVTDPPSTGRAVGW